MCRLLMANKAALATLSDEVLVEWLLSLEESFGGHGNGLGILTDKKLVIVTKGLSLTAEDSVKLIRANDDAEWVIWHTRLSSCMTVDDKYCHPFQYGNLTLAHNGHNAEWAKAGIPYSYSDTQALAVAAAHEGKLRLVRKASGVFIGFESGEPFVIKTQMYTDLVMWEDYNDNGHGLVFASEPIEAIQDNVVVVDTADWTVGEPTENVLNKTMTFSTYHAPVYGTYLNSKGELVTYKKTTTDYDYDYTDKFWDKLYKKDTVDYPAKTEEYWGMSIIDKVTGEVIGEMAEDGSKLYYGDLIDETSPVRTVEAHDWNDEDEFVSVDGVVHKVLHLEEDATVSLGVDDSHTDPIEVEVTSRREARRKRKEEKRRARLENVARHMHPTRQSWQEDVLAEAVKDEAPAMSIVHLPSNYSKWLEEERVAWWKRISKH